MKLVVGVMVKRRRSILFIKRRHGSWPGFWTLPGGKVEENEDFEQAARRELREETGIQAENLTLVSIEHYTDPHGVRCAAMMYINYDSTDKPINMEPEKHSEMAWFQQMSPPSPMIPPVHSFITEHPRLIQGRFNRSRRLIGVLKRGKIVNKGGRPLKSRQHNLDRINPL